MRLFRVHQKLLAREIVDITAAVHQQLDGLSLDVPAGEVAITAGSRGIANIPQIIRAAGDWLRMRGAQPFIVPCMGSHNGATAEGQQQMVESLGITEEAMGMPIRSSMDCVKIGRVATGDIWMDRYCNESAGVLVMNRIKLHTCFSGSVQSGLIKMMVVGMGKIRSAQTFHSANPATMKSMLLEMGQVLLQSGKILAGLAILEDGYDRTAEIHAVRVAEFLDREAELLRRHQQYFAQLPVDQLNVLIVDSIGKTYSGTGMDTNVIGYRGVRGGEDLDRPRIHVIAALELAAASQGNAIGVGLADFITRRLRHAIDEHKTFINVYTTGEMTRAKIPATLADDEEIVARITHRYGTHRWMFIPNTLHLEQLYVTEDLRTEIEQHPRCVVDSDPVELTFHDGRLQLDFSASPPA